MNFDPRVDTDTYLDNNLLGILTNLAYKSAGVDAEDFGFGDNTNQMVSELVVAGLVYVVNSETYKTMQLTTYGQRFMKALLSQISSDLED